MNIRRGASLSSVVSQNMVQAFVRDAVPCNSRVKHSRKIRKDKRRLTKD